MMNERQSQRLQGAEAVATRLKNLQEAVAAGGQFFDPFVSARAQDDLSRTQERMNLGLDVTVVALVGGTGSGKSSLFNAITGLEFADSGDIRPTTERAAACVYGVDATALLDYLAVDHDRRINYTSELNEGVSTFERLVLVDLPDHDSIEVRHSLEVARLLPMIDVLIWILDPQKYADQVLHASYLEQLSDRSDAMVVVINQIDTVRKSHRDLLINDVRALLAKDGLPDVPIVTTSALLGDGIEVLRDTIRTAMDKPSIAATTAAAELDAIGGRLRVNVGNEESDLRGKERDDMISRIAGASGVGAATESIRNAGQSLLATAYVQPEKLGQSMSVAIRDSWINTVRRGLPYIWQQAAESCVASAERIRNSTGVAVRSIEPPQIVRTKAWILSAIAVLVSATGITLGAIGVPYTAIVWRLGMILSGLLIGGALYAYAMIDLRWQAEKLATQYEHDVHQALSAVVDEEMVEAPAEVLIKHKTTRIALETFT